MIPDETSPGSSLDPALAQLMACDELLFGSANADDCESIASQDRDADDRARSRLLLLLRMLDAAEAPAHGAEDPPGCAPRSRRPGGRPADPGPIRDPGRAGLRRVWLRSARARPAAGPRGSAQDAAAGASAQLWRRRAVSARGPRRGPARPSQYRADSRRGRARPARLLHRERVLRGDEPAPLVECAKRACPAQAGGTMGRRAVRCGSACRTTEASSIATSSLRT